MDFRFSLVEPLLPPFPSKTTTLPRASEPSTTGAQRQANGMSCRLAEAASVVMATCHKLKETISAAQRAHSDSRQRSEGAAAARQGVSRMLVHSRATDAWLPVGQSDTHAQG